MTHFDEIASSYDTILPKHITEHYYQKRLAFLSRLANRGKVLDVCSGTGLISQGLIQMGFTVVSLDLSLKMLLMRKDSEDYRAVQGMSYELPFQSGVFDMVISIAALHHIAERMNVKKTINEMKRVARKGGHIVLWDHNPYNPYWKVIMKKVPQDTGEERLIGIDELTEPFRTGGFSFEIYRKGFMPDFMPEKLAGLFRVFEALIEKIPLLNLFTAHNVIVARKL